MEPNFVMYAAGFIVWVLLMYLIIQAATDSRKKVKYMEAQIKLLSQIALANWANAEKVNEVMKEAVK